MAEEGGQLWQMEIKSGAEMQNQVHEAQQAERWAMHEQHEANVRAIAQSRTRLQYAAPRRTSWRAEQRAARHRHRQERHRWGHYPSRTEGTGHGKAEGQGAWAGFREWWRGLLGMNP